MSEFKPGDIVDITIEGARVRAIRGEDTVDHLSYETQGGFVASVALTESVTVERVAPAEWPPRPGDVWLDAEGRAWTALRGRMFPVTSTRGESANTSSALRKSWSWSISRVSIARTITGSTANSDTFALPLSSAAPPVSIR